MGIFEQDYRRGDQLTRAPEEKILGEGNLVHLSLCLCRPVHPPRAGHQARMPHNQVHFDRRLRQR